MGRFVLFISLIFILSSCAFNQAFYFTRSIYTEITPVNYEEIYLTNNRNKKLHAILLNPLNERPKATLLLLHGNGGNVSTWISRAQPLAENGFQVLLFDYEGFGKSEGNPTHKNVLNDSQLFLNYLIKNNSDTLRILLWGFSMGGNLAVELAKNNQDKIVLNVPL